MTRRFKTVLASTAIALVTSLPAVAEIAAGTPITSETLVDLAEMVRLVDTVDAAVDAKDWALARSLTTDEIRMDFTSLIGGNTPGN